MEVNAYENIASQNTWDTAKVALKQKCASLNAYIRKEEKSQINTLNFMPQETTKEKSKINPKKAEGGK